MAENLWRRFRELLPQDPLLVGNVLSHNSDGTSTILLTGGGQLRAQGQDVAVSSKAFVRAGRVQGEAPDLPAYEIEV